MVRADPSRLIQHQNIAQYSVIAGEQFVNHDIHFLAINNHQNRNALRPETLEALADRVEYIAKHGGKYVVFYPGAPSVETSKPASLLGKAGNYFSRFLFGDSVELRSDGPFSQGADVPYMASQTKHTIFEFCQRGQKAIERIENSPLTTIAAMDNYSIGGGNELAMACDYRIATPKTRLMMPERKIGLPCPGWGGTVRLQRHVGPQNTHLILQQGERGRPFAAQTAYDMGWIDLITPEGQDVAHAALDLVTSGAIKFLKSRSLNSFVRADDLPASDLQEALACEAAYSYGTPKLMLDHIESEARKGQRYQQN